MATSPDAGTIDAIQRYVGAALDCPTGYVVAASQFEDGNRHAVYRVDLRTGHAVVVRVSLGNSAGDRDQAAREAAVLALVDGGEAPALYDFRLDNEWFGRPVMCMQFVPGTAQPLSTLDDSRIAELGAVLARIHGVAVEALRDDTTPSDLQAYAAARLESILATLTWADDPAAAAIRRPLLRAADEIRTAFDSSSEPIFAATRPLALLHGDPGPGNVLWGERPVLIDWEYARLGDPADELAYLVDQNGLTERRQSAFWHGYAGSLGATESLEQLQRRTTWWLPVTLLGSTLWWVERWVRRSRADLTGEHDPQVPRSARYYREHADRRLDRLTSALGQGTR